MSVHCWMNLKTKMKKYRCLIVEVSYGYIDVEADNADEAAEIADKQYHAGNTNWGDADYSIEEITEQK